MRYVGAAAGGNNKAARRSNGAKPYCTALLPGSHLMAPECCWLMMSSPPAALYAPPARHYWSPAQAVYPSWRCLEYCRQKILSRLKLKADSYLRSEERRVGKERIVV